MWGARGILAAFFCFIIVCALRWLCDGACHITSSLRLVQYVTVRLESYDQLTHVACCFVAMPLLQMLESQTRMAKAANARCELTLKRLYKLDQRDRAKREAHTGMQNHSKY